MVHPRESMHFFWFDMEDSNAIIHRGFYVSSVLRY